MKRRITIAGLCGLMAAVIAVVWLLLRAGGDPNLRTLLKGMEHNYGDVRIML